MLLKSFQVLTLVATSCHAQYQVDNDVRADITFGVENDRFDVGNIIEEQKRAFNDQLTPMEGGRRSFRPLAEMLKRDRHRYQQAQKSPRRMNNDFADHDQMLDDDDQGDQYEKNLRSLITQTKRSHRKSGRNFFFNRISSKNDDQVEDSVENVEDPVKNVKNLVDDVVDPVSNVADSVNNVEDPISNVGYSVNNVEDPISNVRYSVNNVEDPISNVGDSVSNAKDPIKTETKVPIKNETKTMKGLQEVVLNYLHGGEEVRRGRRKEGANPEDEILLHYAVPIKMKVQGFLELPHPQAL